MPADGDDPVLFGLDAAAIGVVPRLEQAVARLDSSRQAAFRRLLRALNNPMLVLALIGKPRSFGRSLRMTASGCSALAVSRLGILRKGYQAERLAAFLFYSITDDQGQNPTWPALGYVPSANPPSARLLVLTPVDGPTTLECDVCDRLGGGGSVIAAESGPERSVVLEGGSGRQAPDFDQRELTGMNTRTSTRE